LPQREQAPVGPTGRLRRRELRELRELAVGLHVVTDFERREPDVERAHELVVLRRRAIRQRGCRPTRAEKNQRAQNQNPASLRLTLKSSHL
jgi:hypothetical protein